MVMATRPIPIHVAKTQLSKLIERACAGEDVVIARGKTPVVRIVRVHAAPPARKFGAWRGRLRVGEAFFDPLPEDELERWGV